MSLFHYITYKYVIIKDKRLGAAYYVVALIILFYTIIQICVNKAYLTFDFAPRGSIRIIVNTPPSKFEGSTSTPSYCCHAGNSSCIPCRGLDGLSLNWPVESRAVTIASYLKERWEKSNCDESTYDFAEKHTPYTVIRELDFYTVHPEDLLVKIEHSMRAHNGEISGSHRMMDGSLFDIDGKVIKRLNSNGRGSVDRIFLKDFLAAAHVDLNSLSDALNANGRTYRKNGVVLNVVMEYKNADAYWFGIGRISYGYHVRHVPFSDYRVKQEIPIANNNGSICERIVNKRYGVRIEFQQGGKIGQYSLSNLLMQLVSFMGLLTLTATIVDVFALYLVPNKETYRQYVYDSSPDIGRVKRLRSISGGEKEKEE